MNKYYRMIVEEKGRVVVDNLYRKTTRNIEEDGLLALAYGILGWKGSLRAALKNVDPYALDGDARAYFLEASLLNEVYQRKQAKVKITALINEVLTSYPESYYGRQMRAHELFSRGSIDEALETLTDIKADFPEAALDITISAWLLYSGRKDQAKKYIAQIKHPFSRWLFTQVALENKLFQVILPIILILLSLGLPVAYSVLFTSTCLLLARILSFRFSAKRGVVAHIYDRYLFWFLYLGCLVAFVRLWLAG